MYSKEDLGLYYVITLEYEGLHLICFKCDRYGHRRVSRFGA